MTTKDQRRTHHDLVSRVQTHIHKSQNLGIILRISDYNGIFCYLWQHCLLVQAPLLQDIRVQTSAPGHDESVEKNQCDRADQQVISDE